MLTFTDTVVTKAQLVASLERHRAADRIVAGHYWDGNGDGTGCSVGCSIHDFAPGREDQHDAFEDLFGIPQGVARLNDRIFEGLPDDERQDWPLRFANAVPEGADLSRVVPAVLVRTLERRREALAALAITDALRDQVRAAIDQTLTVVRQWRDTGIADESAARSAARSAWSAWSAARSAESAARSAESAARSADESAARSAERSAASAAESAARSAAESAWSAAWSAAESAAESAASVAWSAERSAWSAASAARSAEYRWLADVLIEEMQAAHV